MRILITGAFGNLGLMCIEQALELGYELICFDLDNPNNRNLARGYGDRITPVFGDICQSATLTPLVNKVDAIIHNASVLPPTTENNPQLADKINVQACQRLIDIAANSPSKPKFIFPSSVTVFGLPENNSSFKSAEDAIAASDNYTTHKITIENYLKTVDLPWVVLRVGVSVDSRTLGTDKQTFIKLLSVKADNPMEYVHPKDVALAMCRAAACSSANNKVLLIGGGEDCRITQFEFLSVAFRALGLRLDRSVFGENAFYTHWMSTSEANEILDFQQHKFSAYADEMNNKMKWIRFIIRPLAFLLNPLVNGLLKSQVKKLAENAIPAQESAGFDRS
jgi:nucleoside-diphosphate-sugar epimerase